MTAAMVSSLIECKRIRTTQGRAKVARVLAEKLVTVAKQGTLAARRRVIQELAPQKKAAAKLFSEIVPQFSDRQGGYTRMTKLGRRKSDSSEMVVLEWVGIAAPVRVKKTAKGEAKKDEAK